MAAWPERPVPVFPLPNVVLFPHVVIPLHVFELRYRTMIRDVLSAGRHLALALLLPGWERDYHGSPEFHSTVCLATVTGVEWLPDDCYDLTVKGVARARVSRIAREYPYRAARLEPHPEHPLAADDPLVELERRAMLGAARRMSRESAGEAGPAETLGLEAITNFVCTFAPLEPEEKQRLLAEDNVVERARRMRGWVDRWLVAGAPPATGESGPN